MRRFGFFWHDSHDEPFRVDVNDEEEATEAFRKQWTAWIEMLMGFPQNKGKTMKELEFATAEEKLAEEYTLREVGLEELKWNPRPTCCDKANEVHRFDEDKGPPVQLHVHKLNPNPKTWDYFIEPHWMIRTAGFEISFCPFCGTNLPEVELMEDPPKPLHDDPNADGYCGTCDERSMCCECNPPWAAYRIKT